MAVIAIKNSEIQKYKYRATGGEIEISPPINLSIGEVFVYLNGLLLLEGNNKDYIINKTENKIIFSAMLSNGDILQIIVI